jgi:hypothetical protein
VASAITTVVLYAVAPRTAEKAEKARVSVDVAPTGIVLRGVF